MLNFDMNELNVSPHVISKFKFIVSRLVSRCSFYVLAPMFQQVHFIYGQNLKRGSKKRIYKINTSQVSEVLELSGCFMTFLEGKIL